MACCSPKSISSGYISVTYNLQTLAEGCQKESATKLMLTTVVGLAADPVPNVKFNVAKTLMRVGQWLDTASIQQQVKPVLDKLKQDPDSDVQYFAVEAIECKHTMDENIS